MSNRYLEMQSSPPLSGTVHVNGAKNAVLAMMTSLLLTRGKSLLHNVPVLTDVHYMCDVLRSLGAYVMFDTENNQLLVDTTYVDKFHVSAELMRKMRASVLVMGPLLARFGKAQLAFPGGDLIGARPIDFHLTNLQKMGSRVMQEDDVLHVEAPHGLRNAICVLEYPSVGATENIMMAASLTPGITRIVNAALEPEVLDVMNALRTMGSRITVLPPSTIEIEGVATLAPIEYKVMPDRLEAGSLLLAAAMTGGSITIANAQSHVMDVFLYKLEQMGHHITCDISGLGITLQATDSPQAVSFTTDTYPGFPTDLQAPMMAAQCIAQGESIIYETVYENRLIHVRELQKMGAQIKIVNDKAYVTGVDQLFGANLIASDIRASCALVLAGLIAQGVTQVSGVDHWQRGYQDLEQKLATLGANIVLKAS